METLTKIKLGLAITILSVVAIILLGFIVYILTTSLSTALLRNRIGSFYGSAFWASGFLGKWMAQREDEVINREK